MTIKRISFLQELLAFIGLEGRLHLEWISSAEAQKFVQVVTAFTEKIRKLGPNPIMSYQNSVPLKDTQPDSKIVDKPGRTLPEKSVRPMVAAAH